MKICVADDEREVRSSIVQKLTRLFPEEQIFDVGFGNQALEQILSVQPNLVFLDIRMPEMDGLEMLRNIKKTLPTIQVVIISGYDDFEYARASLRHGAMNYLLKPADPMHLKESVEAVRQVMADVFQQEFERLCSRHPNTYIDYENLEIYDLSLWFDEREWKTVSFELEEEASKSGRQRLFDFTALSSICVSVVKAEGLGASGFAEKNACIPYLIAEVQRREQELFFGYSRAGIKLASHRDERKRVQQLGSQLLSSAIEGDLERLEPILAEWFSCLNAFSLPELRRECAQLMSTLEEAVQRPEIIVIDGERNDYWLQWVSEHERWTGLQSSIRSIVVGGIRALKQVGEEAREALSGNWFKQVIRLLESSSSSELSLESVAATVGVHPVTLSRIFKQQKGVNFVKYLTSRRLELAKKLLQTTDKRINDISEEVGYVDYRYFRSLFKKEYGVSPSDYRRRSENAVANDEQGAPD